MCTGKTLVFNLEEILLYASKNVVISSWNTEEKSGLNYSENLLVQIEVTRHLVIHKDQSN